MRLEADHDARTNDNHQEVLIKTTLEWAYEPTTEELDEMAYVAFPELARLQILRDEPTTEELDEVAYKAFLVQPPNMPPKDIIFMPSDRDWLVCEGKACRRAASNNHSLCKSCDKKKWSDASRKRYYLKRHACDDCGACVPGRGKNMNLSYGCYYCSGCGAKPYDQCYGL